MSASGSFVEAWRQQFAAVLSQATGQEWTARKATGSADCTGVAYGLRASGALEGTVYVRFGQGGAAALGAAFAGLDGDAADFEGERKDAFEELLRQVAGQVSAAVRAEYGDVTWELAAGERDESLPASRVAVEGPGCAVEFEIVGCEAAAASLNRGRTAAREASEATGHPKSDMANLDLLMDVELDATLRFGKRTLLLREVMDLGLGAVVELDRKVEDPVELLLGERVIARGEVVIIDGSYGLRVTEVGDPAPTMAAVQRAASQRSAGGLA